MNILIVDDNPKLRSQLKRLVKEVIIDWNTLEADHYHDAINLINNNQLDILVCDLFLSSNEGKITKEDYIPEGIKVAQEAKQRNSNLFVIIVTSYLDSFLSNHQLLDYMEAGVNVFFDRAATPYEKFSDLFQYQLKIASDSIIFPDDSASKLWINLNIESCRSYWIFVCDLNDREHHNLIGDCLIWEKSIPKPGASVLLVDIHDENKLPYLIEKNIIDDINDYPILLIGESSEMLSNIKIANSTLNVIQENNNITKFLNLIHAQLRYKNISEISNKMESSQYWEWLDIDYIEGFDYEQGSFILRQENNNQNMPSNYTDNRRVINIDNSTFDVTGANSFSFGDNDGTIANTINQLPNFDNEPHKRELKQLLSQLPKAVLGEDLDEEEKSETLEQIQTIAEALQNPQDNAVKKTAKRAMRIIRGIATTLPPSAAMVTICNQLPDLISKIF